MYNSLTCVIRDSVDTTDYGDLFDYFYGLDDGKYINGVRANGTSGVYGDYSMCSSKQQLAWAMNAYYQAQDGSSSACDFSSKASTRAATSATGSCSSLMASIGTAGTGAVSYTVSGTGSGSGSSSSSSGAAFPVFSSTPIFVGNWQFGAYIVAAIFSGAAMLVL
jgi:hypothetical protein